MEQFCLNDEDYYAIEIARDTIRLFLKSPLVTPQQIIGLGNALYALDRLPLITDGACCEFGIVYRAGTEEFEEMRYITFRISDSSFSISKGGSVYDNAVGSDSFSDPDWIIELDGYRETEMELFNLEESITEYLNLGAEITVDDESEIDFNQDE